MQYLSLSEYKSYINPSTNVQTIDKVALALFQSTLLRRLSHT